MRHCSYNNLVQQVAGSRNQTIVLWDFDSGDSTGSTPDQSNAAYAGLNTPSILALNHETIGKFRSPFNIVIGNGADHRNSESTVKVLLPAAIATLKRKGYNLVTVAECLGLPAYLNTGSPQTGTFSC